MKLFFGADTTYDKNNIDFECGDFKTREISPEQLHLIDERDKIVDSVNQQFELSDAATNIGAISTVATALGLAVMLRSMIDMSWTAFWRSDFAIGCVIWVAVFGIITGIFFLKLHTKRMDAAQDENVQRNIELIEAIERDCCNTLGVPEDAPMMDILASLYNVKKGKVVIRRVNGDAFSNMPMRVFRTDNALCFAVMATRWDIPLSEITGIQTIKKRVTIPVWHKETMYNKGEYKEYRMAATSNGSIILRHYHALCITRNGEDYELYFPPYELPVIEQLTGIKAEM